MKYWIALTLQLALICACGNDVERVCDPGEQQHCGCLAGAIGIQVCADNGYRWETCECPDPVVDSGVDDEVDAGDTGDPDPVDGGGDTDPVIDSGSDTWTDASTVATDPSCDPNGIAPCTSDVFSCYFSTASNSIRCRGTRAIMPVDGSWRCEVYGSTILCGSAQSSPPEGTDMECRTTSTGSQVCMRLLYYPSGFTVEGWNCVIEDSYYLHCESTQTPSAFGECCTPTATRYCVDVTTSHWGIQECEEPGGWGACEPLDSLPQACRLSDEWFSPEAAACCIENFCCLDVWDYDEDMSLVESLGDCGDTTCS